jgi:phosphohistidine phosphatase
VSYLLYLVRHAIAETRGQTADADRRLTAQGVRRMQRAARGLKRLGVVPDLILSSPLRRAEETAGILLPILAPDLPIEIYPSLAPGNPISEVISGLRAYRQAQRLVLVGHQPSLGELASQLLTGSPSLLPLPFKKGGAAAIEVTALPPREAGRLNWFLTAKQLRLMARSKRPRP